MSGSLNADNAFSELWRQRSRSGSPLRLSWGDKWCLWWHRRLVVTARVGSGIDHVRCGKCEREYGVNHRSQVVVPWSTANHRRE
jgi:hypothetical protein